MRHGEICKFGTGAVSRVVPQVVDVDQNRIAAWKSSQLPIYEPGLLSIVRTARDGTERLRLGARVLPLVSQTGCLNDMVPSKLGRDCGGRQLSAPFSSPSLTIMKTLSAL
ncbi:MAG: hypothetical protein EOO39_47280 [Cytophagaceae bacterium]|nr:MAG: hypothetical protein EOO39_47280 [Cytophagaceae bacterium]